MGRGGEGGGGGVDALSVQQGGIILIITIIMWLSQSSLFYTLTSFFCSFLCFSRQDVIPRAGSRLRPTFNRTTHQHTRRPSSSSILSRSRRSDHLSSPLKRVSRQDLSDSDNTKAVPFCSIFQSSVSSWGKPRRRRSYPLPLCIFAYPLPIALHFDNRWRPKQTAHQPKVGPLARINDRRGASTRLSRFKKKKKTIVSPQNALVRVGNSGSKQRGLP